MNLDFLGGIGDIMKKHLPGLMPKPKNTQEIED